jgi:phosphoglycerate dehydrogenase-like enzyme
VGKIRVLFHYDAGPALQRDLLALEAEGLEIVCCDERDDARFRALLPDAQVLWHVLRPITAADLEQAGNLQLIQKIGVGVNTIDLDLARSRGIAVCNMPGTNTRAVAELTLLLMLACLRRLPVLDRETRAGKGWQLDSSIQENCHEIGGRTVGLVGYGAVPRMLGPILHAMGAKVIYTARNQKPNVAWPFRSLPELLRESDVLSLHVPLTDDTKCMIDKERIALLRRGSVVINTARGGLIDQDALMQGLLRGHIGAAGLDVFALEPAPQNESLFGLDNVVVTPHVAWLTRETLKRSLQIAVENCRRLQAGDELLNRVV